MVTRARPWCGDVQERVLGEVAAMFPDDYLHIGGDEASLQCWDTAPHIAAFARARNFTSNDLLAYFTGRVVEIARRVAGAKKLIVWQVGLHLRFMRRAQRLTSSHAVIAQELYAQMAAAHADLDPSFTVEPWRCWGSSPASTVADASSQHHGIVNSACWFV